MGVGTEVTAIADYMQFWFTTVPPWIWIVLFSVLYLLPSGGA